MCAGCKQLHAVAVNPLFSCGKNDTDAGKRVIMSVPPTPLWISFLSAFGEELNLLPLLSDFFFSSLSFGVTVGREANPNVLHPRTSS